jgi:hypothetical protein
MMGDISRTGLHSVSPDNLPPITFDMWDCESTLWLRWCFWKARKISLQPLIERIPRCEEEEDGAVSEGAA